MSTARSTEHDYRPTRRRTAAAVAVLTMVLATLGVAANPAAAAAPAAPKLLSAIGYADAVRLYWAPPTDDGGSPITGYKIERKLVNVVTGTWTVESTAPYFDTTAVPGPLLINTYTVSAINADGTGPLSNQLSARKDATQNDFTKFGAGAGAQSAFVQRQYQDLLGRPPTAAELSTALDGFGDSSLTAATFTDSLVNQPTRVFERQPVIRLYFAYFDRAPDHGGMDFWVNARKTGGKSIDDESSSFAGSNEFKTTYGSLSTLGFVTLVYNNVLKRDPDTDGLNFWTNRLDNNLDTRGRMMTQFSESNEFKNASKGRTLAADVYDDLYGAMIPAAELADWGSHIQSGGTAGGYATVLIRGAGYTVT